MVGFEKDGKRRVPFAVQCKSVKCTIQPCLNIIYNLKYYKILRHTITLRKQYTSSGILALDAVLPLPVVVRTVHWTKTPLDSPAMDRPSTPIKSSILQKVVVSKRSFHRVIEYEYCPLPCVVYFFILFTELE
jgi:hypothetical protein